MGQLAIPLMIASTVVSTIGAYRGAQAEKQNAKYQAGVARNNAIYQRQAEERNLLLAEDARKRGQMEEYRQRLKTRDVAAQQRSSLAAAGVDLSIGSPLDLIGDTFELGEMDALTVRNNAAREANQYENAAWSNRVGQSNYTAQAGMFDAQASNISPGMSAFTTFLDGATTTYSAWNQVNPKLGDKITWNGPRYTDNPGYYRR